jgi:hypothetical protein
MPTSTRTFRVIVTPTLKDLKPDAQYCDVSHHDAAP